MSWLKRILARQPPPAQMSDNAFLPDRDDLGFGYKTWWMVVRGSNPREVADALELEVVEVSQPYKLWRAVFDSCRSDTAVFSTTGGWTIALFPPLHDEPVVHRRVEELSHTFGEVQLYISQRVSGCFGWVRAREGALIRAWHEADGELLFDEGLVTEPESRFRSEDPENEYLPNEEHVIEMARAWSFDPLSLTASDVVGDALICRPQR